jgi:DNA-binding response OmpR family regulator
MADSARILIVEDEPILALELKEDLQDMGFVVSDVVTDGDMVLRSFLRDRPDIVLMDIRLQGFRDGIESAAQIRGFFATPIIYLSSLPEKEVEHRLPRTAPYAYVQKPYELPRLKNALDLALQL